MTPASIMSWVRETALVAGCILLMSGCAASPTAQPVLKMVDVVGMWSNHKGSTITFQADGRFSSVAMDLGWALAGCRNVSGPGNWDFLSPEGDSPSGDPYTSGNQIELSFDGQNDSCDASLTSWEISPPVGLCLDLDPDSPCTGIPWTKDH